MAHTYSISEFGLRLIKAYEGFRPVETKLVSGQRVIGYGHLHEPGEIVMLTRKRAEALLLTDLAPYEALINDNVYAPLSQSQFDALVSLSFNIGEDAFLNSSVLYHLNTGQPLAAAAGFDEWRKSVIGGKAYIVDALVRRRTAEKALFLRPPTGIVATPRHELPPTRVLDTRDDDGATEVFEKPDTSGFVEQAPYGASASQASILTLNQTVEDNAALPEDIHTQDGVVSEDVAPEETTFRETASIEDATIDEALSPIAVAAAQVSERLDRLIDEEQGEDVDHTIVGEHGLQTSAPIEVVNEDVPNEDAPNKEVGKEEIGQVFPTMTLVEMDIPTSIDYNLQAPNSEEIENEKVEKLESTQEGPVLTLVERDNDFLVDQPIHTLDNDELKTASEFSHPAHNVHNGEPEAEDAKGIDDWAAHEADTQSTDIQSATDAQNTIDEYGTTAPQDNAPIAALQNASPNLVAEDTSKGIGPYLAAPVIGLLLLGAGLWKTRFAPAVNTNDWSAFMAPVALLIGGLMLLGGLYYMFKAHFSQSAVN